jgi:hypothetical protein
VFASEVRDEGTGDDLLVRNPAIDALVDSFHYGLYLVVPYGGESPNPDLHQQHHAEHVVITAHAQITWIDNRILGLDVPVTSHCSRT